MAPTMLFLMQNRGHTGGTFIKSNRRIVNKGNNKITEFRTIFQRESQNS